jgi:ribosomal protein S18 acetylase RimI-like enzyme
MSFEPTSQIAPGVSLERATIEDLIAVADAQGEFWGERDMRLLHHSMFVHEFGETSLVIRDTDGLIRAYLFGFVTVDRRVGYVHLIAVRSTYRREGYGRQLYAAFETLARKRGAVALKAMTQPVNTRSIAFHRSLGMSVTEVPDYVGKGETRVVFWRDLV